MTQPLLSIGIPTWNRARYLEANLRQLELTIVVATYVVLSPWWHCYNYCLIHAHGHEIMQSSVATGIVGVALWVVLMWHLGPIGIYLGFFAQMILRVAAIVTWSRKRWVIQMAWDGVAAGLVLVGAGYLVSTL